MQWFIDIIMELVEALGYLTTAWVDRGDPANPDFQAGDLTGDNAWRDLDLSGIIPSGAQSVLLRVTLISNTLAKTIAFRKKGHVNWPNVAYCQPQVANVAIAFDKTIALDTNRIIQYRKSAAIGMTIQITVAAWIF